ncbi:MAG: cytidine deaminase [Gammaproteobacteria bacterium]|nr:cytidine deaminase [Gammaproteobacteria bacterium]
MLNTMLEKAKAAMKNAYSPYSKFQVGVCIRTDCDQLFSGCNVENASYSTTLCAESSAIGSMITAGAKNIKEIVIVNSGNTPCPPCGACRQRILELSSSPDTKIHLYDSNDTQHTMTINELLPGAFAPSHLEE